MCNLERTLAQKKNRSSYTFKLNLYFDNFSSFFLPPLTGSIRNCRVMLLNARDSVFSE